MFATFLGIFALQFKNFDCRMRSSRKERKRAPVAQLDRVPGYEPGGRGFESYLAHQSFKAQLPNGG